MTHAIPLSTTGGRYGECVNRAIVSILASPGINDTAIRLLDLLVNVTSEHTLSLAIRSFRDRPHPSPSDIKPCEDAVRQSAAKLSARDEAQDTEAASILLLLASLCSESELDRTLAIIELHSPKAQRKAA